MTGCISRSPLPTSKNGTVRRSRCPSASSMDRYARICASLLKMCSSWQVFLFGPGIGMLLLQMLFGNAVEPGCIAALVGVGGGATDRGAVFLVQRLLVLQLDLHEPVQ